MLLPSRPEPIDIATVVTTHPFSSDIVNSALAKYTIHAGWNYTRLLNAANKLMTKMKEMDDDKFALTCLSFGVNISMDNKLFIKNIKTKLCPIAFVMFLYFCANYPVTLSKTTAYSSADLIFTSLKHAFDDKLSTSAIFYTMKRYLEQRTLSKEAAKPYINNFLALK